MPFADKAKALMEKEKITQARLAEITGISPSMISRYLSGETVPKADVAELLLSALGADAEKKAALVDDSAVSMALGIIRDTYEARIVDLQRSMLAEKREKWIFVVLLAALLFIDITNGGVGWFRY